VLTVALNEPALGILERMQKEEINQVPVVSEGQIVGEEIECPWHTSHFNIKTGRVTIDPATKDVATYSVRLVGDAVEVEI